MATEKAEDSKETVCPTEGIRSISILLTDGIENDKIFENGV